MVGNIQKTQKIVQLSSVHPSNDTRVFHKMSKSLIDLGYDLDLLIQHPKDEVLEKVNIIALPIAFKKYDRLTKVIPIILKKSFRYEKGTIFQIHDSELILFGLVLKCFGYKIIYDAHENTPKDFLSKEWIPFIFRYPFSQIVSFLEYLADSFFDGIITTSAPITKRYKNKNLFEIRNYPKLDSSIRSICQVPFSEKKNQIIYVGGITERRGIIEMVKAMGILGQNFDLKLILGGKFAPPNLQEKVSILDGWEYCEFLGWLELNQLWSKVSESKIGLVVIQPFESHFTQLPVKLFEYMASGVPVVCSDFPMYREIVDNEKCGLLVDPTSPDKITEAVSWLLNNPTSAERMGQRGRKAVLEKLNWETEEKKLLNLYQRLIAN